MSIFAELKRRNVIRVAVAYIIAAWLILQVADVVLGNIVAPDWVFQAILLVVLIGFPLAILFAWAFELTPEGLKRESEVDRTASVTHKTGHKLDRAIIAALIVAVAYFAYDKFYIEDQANEVPTTTIANDGEPNSPTVSNPSIAVLPFVNMSSDPEQEYFSDGISEELLNLLAKVPQFQVSGRTSSFAFKGENDDLRVIGERLGVDNILEGSVRKGGDRVRITAQLVKVDDGFHLWSETYDREVDDIFAVQDEIATAVVNELKATLLGFEVPESNNSPLYANADAHNFYLQGLFFLNKAGPDNFRKASEYFQQAVDLVPESALAWASLASAHIQYSAQGDLETEEALASGREELAKAFSIADDVPEVHVARAELAILYDWDWSAADEAIERALSLRPGDIDAGIIRADLDKRLGRPDKALNRYSDLLSRDPFDQRLQAGLAQQLMEAGRWAEAEAQLMSILERDATASYINASLGWLLLMDGRPEESLSYVKREPVQFVRVTNIAIVENALGNTEAATRAQQELLDLYGDAASYQQAQIFAEWGEPDRAVEWLERAYDVRDPGLPNVNFDVQFRSLRDHPGYIAILEK
jgi:adenylate cyclase